MPTTKPRIAVPVTAEVERALARADLIWPGQPRSQLIVDIVLQWAEQQPPVDDEAERERRIEARRRAIRETAGSLTAAFPEGYLEELRQDWPE